MTVNESCNFCSRPILADRIIRANDFMISIVPRHWFRPSALVIPSSHVTRIAEMSPDEMTAVMCEVGRLSLLLDEGFGTGVMQKYQPEQPQNGIKMDHLHMHAFARLPAGEEVGLFPMPVPNSFDGFRPVTEREIAQQVQRLR